MKLAPYRRAPASLLALERRTELASADTARRFDGGKSMRTRWFTPILAGLLFALPVAWATEPEPQLYEVVTETGMPHLEENLRYATRVERCQRTSATFVGQFWTHCRENPRGEAELRGC